MSEQTPFWRRMAENAGLMVSATPQAMAIGMEMVLIEQGRAIAKVSPREDLIGDPDTGVIAGGVITTLLDNTCGVATVSALNAPQSTATLDLRIDYMRPARPGAVVYAEAIVTKVTRSVVFVRAFAYEDGPDDPIAAAQAAFMLSANAGRKAGANLDKAAP
jgi:uncharacterized protein (TIGR00369 family)